MGHGAARGGPPRAGWAIPMATDIAFAVGILAVLGDRVSAGVKLLVLAIAVVDDIIAIAVIAVFYSAHIHPGWLCVAVHRRPGLRLSEAGERRQGGHLRRLAPRRPAGRGRAAATRLSDLSPA